MKTHRIAVLGLSHDHVWSNVEELLRFSRAEVVGAADPDAELREKFAETHEVPVFETPEALLDSDDGITAVYIFGNNREGEDLAVLACERGLPFLIEKPLASTRAGADRIVAAVEKAGVIGMVNWPFTWWPKLQEAIRIAQSGDIGEVWQVKYRASHCGPVELDCSKQFCAWLYDEALNGAGALMDYCCYGSVLADVLLGLPDSVTGVKLSTGQKPDLALEDNAILVMSYGNKLATTEASWTQIGNLTSYETVIFGTRGTLFVERDYSGRLMKATSEEPNGVEVEVPELPEHLWTASANFIAAVEANDPTLIHPLCQLEHARHAQWILEAGLESANNKGSAASL